MDNLDKQVNDNFLNNLDKKVFSKKNKNECDCININNFGEYKK